MGSNDWETLVTDNIGSIDVSTMTALLTTCLTIPKAESNSVLLEGLLELIRKWLHAVCDCSLAAGPPDLLNVLNGFLAAEEGMCNS